MLKDEAGIDYPRVSGGYKAMRTFLLNTLDQAVTQCDFVLLGGMTGTGKTEVLTQLRNGLDLEGHANHRGSSFGKHATGQPSNIDFENRLAVDVRKNATTASSSSCWKTRAGRSALRAPLPLYPQWQRQGATADRPALVFQHELLDAVLAFFQHVHRQAVFKVDVGRLASGVFTETGTAMVGVAFQVQPVAQLREHLGLAGAGHAAQQHEIALGTA